MRPKWITILALVAAGLCSCTHSGPKRDRLNAVEGERVRELVQAAKYSNESAGGSVAEVQRSLERVTNSANWRAETEKASVAARTSAKAVKFTAGQLERANLVAGGPVEDQKPRVERFLSEREAENRAAEAAEAARIVEEEKWRSEKRKMEEKLIEYGEKYEIERNRGVVKRIWLWATGTLGLAGGIAFLVLCPAVALPLLGRLLGWIITILPSVGNFIGLIGHNVVTGIVRGVERAKQGIGTVGTQVLENELSREMDRGPKKVVREIKKRERVESD